MSNSQPEVKTEEKETQPEGKRKKLFSKRKEKPEKAIPGKTTRSKQKARQEEEVASENLTRKQQKAKRKAEKKKNKKPRRRAFPIWLRIIVVLLLCVGALVLGAVVGYGVIGNGKPSDAFEMETWRHVLDIVMKTE